MLMTSPSLPAESCLLLRLCFEGFKLCNFSFRFVQDHARSNLIWNFKTREELRDTLESEMRAFNIDRELGSANVISWNHQEFEVNDLPWDKLHL